MKEQVFIVPTPIGNLGDITLRAIEILKTVDVIACEDTRVTQKLLNHYKIHTKTVAYHKFNERETVDKIIKIISEGKKVALVSDAGTPLISDPGNILVEELRKHNIKITALPGASALVTFLSQVPSGDQPFTFIGFMPRKETQIIDIVRNSSYFNLVFYESPNRLLKTLNVLLNEFGSTLKIAIGRELTKTFEEVIVLNVDEVMEYYSKNTLKGEIVGMIYKFSNSKDECMLQDKIEKLKALNFSTRDIAAALHSLYDENKNDILKLITKK